MDADRIRVGENMRIAYGTCVSCAISYDKWDMRNYFPGSPSLLRFSDGVISAFNKTTEEETNHVRAGFYNCLLG